MNGSRHAASALLLALCLAVPVHGDGAAFARTAALEIGIGTQGIFSYEEIGLRLPMFGKSFFVALKARFLSSMTWATFIDLRTGESVSLHPDVVGGIVSFGGYSPGFRDDLRAYGGCDILIGYSFTPWDSAIYGTGNLIGNNLTFAILGYAGIELFTSPRMAVYLDAGGGFKSMFGDKTNPYVIASSWLGSGFGIRTGMRFYR